MLLLGFIYIHIYIGKSTMVNMKTQVSIMYGFDQLLRPDDEN